MRNMMTSTSLRLFALTASVSLKGFAGVVRLLLSIVPMLPAPPWVIPIPSPKFGLLLPVERLGTVKKLFAGEPAPTEMVSFVLNARVIPCGIPLPLVQFPAAVELPTIKKLPLVVSDVTTDA